MAPCDIQNCWVPFTNLLPMHATKPRRRVSMGQMHCMSMPSGIRLEICMQNLQHRQGVKPQGRKRLRFIACHISTHVDSTCVATLTGCTGGEKPKPFNINL